jgi:nucleoid-associated protein YgaU
MFLKNSRYYQLETSTTRDHSGREVSVLKLRRLPATSGTSYRVQGSDQLDVLSEQKYKDATRYWHIADANSELQANDLTAEPGRLIKVPER